MMAKFEDEVIDDTLADKTCFDWRLQRQAKAAALRAGGQTYRVIARQIGVNETTVRRWLGSDGARPGPPWVIDLASVLALHKAGLSQRKIAAELGVSRGAVRRRLALVGRAAWPTNPPKG